MKKGNNILALASNADALQELIDLNLQISTSLSNLLVEQQLTNEYLKSISGIEINKGDICQV